MIYVYLKIYLNSAAAYLDSADGKQTVKQRIKYL